MTDFSGFDPTAAVPDEDTTGNGSGLFADPAAPSQGQAGGLTAVGANGAAPSVTDTGSSIEPFRPTVTVADTVSANGLAGGPDPTNPFSAKAGAGPDTTNPFMAGADTATTMAAVAKGGSDTTVEMTREYNRQLKLLDTLLPGLTQTAGDAVAKLLRQDMSDDELVRAATKLGQQTALSSQIRQYKAYSTDLQRAQWRKIPIELRQAMLRGGYNLPDADHTWYIPGTGHLIKGGIHIGSAVGAGARSVQNAIEAVGGPAMDVLNNVTGVGNRFYRASKFTEERAADRDTTEEVAIATYLRRRGYATVDGALVPGSTKDSDGIRGIDEAARLVDGGGGTIPQAVIDAAEKVGHQARSEHEDLANRLFGTDNNFWTSQWGRAKNGERFLDPHTELAMFRSVGEDEYALSMAKSIAAGSKPDDLVNELALRAGAFGTPAYVRQQKRLADIYTSDGFKRAVRLAQGGHISFGRTIARDTFQLDPGTTGYSLVSGGLDALSTIYTDPTFIAGKGLEAARAGRLAIAGGETVRRMQAITELTKNGHTLSSLTHDAITSAPLHKGVPGILWDRGIKAAAMRTDAALEKATKAYLDSDGAWGKFQRDNPWAAHLSGGISQFNTALRDKRGFGIAAKGDLWDWLASAEGLNALADGAAMPAWAKYGTFLPQYHKLDAQRLLRGTWTKAIDFSTQKGMGIVGKGNESGGLTGFATKAVGRLASSPGQVGRGLSVMMPHGAVIDYSQRGLEELTRTIYTMMATSGGDRSVADAAVGALTRGLGETRTAAWVDEAGKHVAETVPGMTQASLRTVMRSYMDNSIKAQMAKGRVALPEVDDAVDSYLNRIMRLNDRYAPNGWDVHNGTRSAVFQSQLSTQFATPDLRGFQALLNKASFTRRALGFTQAPAIESAMRSYWKPSMLLRVGFIPRAAGEEMLAFAMRAGVAALPSGWAAHYSARGSLAPELAGIEREADSFASTRAGLFASELGVGLDDPEVKRVYDRARSKSMRESTVPHAEELIDARKPGTRIEFYPVARQMNWTLRHAQEWAHSDEALPDAVRNRAALRFGKMADWGEALAYKTSMWTRHQARFLTSSDRLNAANRMLRSDFASHAFADEISGVHSWDMAADPNDLDPNAANVVLARHGNDYFVMPEMSDRHLPMGESGHAVADPIVRTNLRINIATMHEDPSMREALDEVMAGTMSPAQADSFAQRMSGSIFDTRPPPTAAGATGPLPPPPGLSGPGTEADRFIRYLQEVSPEELDPRNVAQIDRIRTVLAMNGTGVPDEASKAAHDARVAGATATEPAQVPAHLLDEGTDPTTLAVGSPGTDPNVVATDAGGQTAPTASAATAAPAITTPTDAPGTELPTASPDAVPGPGDSPTLGQGAPDPAKVPTDPNVTGDGGAPPVGPPDAAPPPTAPGTPGAATLDQYPQIAGVLDQGMDKMVDSFVKASKFSFKDKKLAQGWSDWLRQYIENSYNDAVERIVAANPDITEEALARRINDLEHGDAGADAPTSGILGAPRKPWGSERPVPRRGEKADRNAKTATAHHTERTTAWLSDLKARYEAGEPPTSGVHAAADTAVAETDLVPFDFNAMPGYKPPVAGPPAPATPSGEANPLEGRSRSTLRAPEVDAAFDQYLSQTSTPVYANSVSAFLRSDANPLYDEAKAKKVAALRKQLLDVMGSEEFHAERGRKVDRTAQNLARVKYGELANEIDSTMADIGMDQTTVRRLQAKLPSGAGEGTEAYRPWWPDEGADPKPVTGDGLRRLTDDELTDRMMVLEKEREAAFNAGDLDFVQKSDDRLQTLYDELNNKSAMPRADATVTLPDVESANHEPGSIGEELAANRKRRMDLNAGRPDGWTQDVKALDARARQLRGMRDGTPIPDPLDPNHPAVPGVSHANGAHPVPDLVGDPVFDQATGDASEAFTAADARLHMNLDAQATESDPVALERLKVDAAALMRNRNEAYRRFQSEAKRSAREAAGTIGDDAQRLAGQTVDTPLAQAILAVSEAKTQLSTNRLNRTHALLRGRTRIVEDYDTRATELVYDLADARARLARLQHGVPTTAAPKLYGPAETAKELGQLPQQGAMFGDSGKRVLVAGSRDYKGANAYAAMSRHLDGLRAEMGDFTVVAGGAPGADRLAERWARERGLPVEVHRANWDEEGKAAGFNRNRRMLDSGVDRVLGFTPTDELTPGTKHMLDIAERSGVHTTHVTPGMIAPGRDVKPSAAVIDWTKDSADLTDAELAARLSSKSAPLKVAAADSAEYQRRLVDRPATGSVPEFKPVLTDQAAPQDLSGGGADVYHPAPGEEPPMEPGTTVGEDLQPATPDATPDQDPTVAELEQMWDTAAPPVADTPTPAVTAPADPAAPVVETARPGQRTSEDVRQSLADRSARIRENEARVARGEAMLPLEDDLPATPTSTGPTADEQRQIMANLGPNAPRANEETYRLRQIYEAERRADLAAGRRPLDTNFAEWRSRVGGSEIGRPARTGTSMEEREYRSAQKRYRANRAKAAEVNKRAPGSAEAFRIEVEGDDLREQLNAAGDAMDLLDARRSRQVRHDNVAALTGIAPPAEPPSGGLGASAAQPPAPDGRHPALAIQEAMLHHYDTRLTPADRLLFDDLVEAGGPRWLYDEPDQAGTRLAHRRRFSRPRESWGPDTKPADMVDLGILTKRGTPMELSRETIKRRMEESPDFAAMVDASQRLDDPALMRLITNRAPMAVRDPGELQHAMVDAVARGQRRPESAGAIAATERTRTLADGTPVAMMPGQDQAPVYTVMLSKAAITDLYQRLDALGVDQLLNSMGLGQDAQMRRFFEGLDADRTAGLAAGARSAGLSDALQAPSAWVTSDPDVAHGVRDKLVARLQGDPNDSTLGGFYVDTRGNARWGDEKRMGAWLRGPHPEQGWNVNPHWQAEIGNGPAEGLIDTRQVGGVFPIGANGAEVQRLNHEGKVSANGAHAVEGATLDQALAEQAELKAKIAVHYLTNTRGDVLHQVVQPLRVHGQLDPLDFERIAWDDMPAQVVGKPRVLDASEVTEGRWLARVIRHGFNRVIGPAISSLVRQPMFLDAYMKGLEQAQQTSSLLRNSPEMEARFTELVDRLNGGPSVTALYDKHTNLGQSRLDNHARARGIVDGSISVVDPDAELDLLSSEDMHLAWQTSRIEERIDHAIGGGAVTPDHVKRWWDDLPAEVQDRWSKLTLGEQRSALEEHANAPITAELDPKAMKVLGDWATFNHNVDGIEESLATRFAVNTTVPYIDDHNIRSTFADEVRNVVPFMFAEEQFLRRWAKTMVQSPTAIRKTQLLLHGMETTGVVQTDPTTGRKMFVYPGSADLMRILTSTPIGKVFGGVSMPVVQPLSGDVMHMLPGMSQPGGASFSPVVSLPANFAAKLFPELKPGVDGLLGSHSGEDAYSQLVPSWARTAWKWTSTDESDVQLNSAAIQTMKLLHVRADDLRARALVADHAGDTAHAVDLRQQADETAPGDDARAIDIKRFEDKVRRNTKVQFLVRGLLGFFGPVTPTAQVVDKIHPELSALFSTMPVDQAIDQFLHDHPDETADTVFSTKSVGGAHLPVTKGVDDYLKANPELAKRYPYAGGYLLPQDPGDMDPSAWEAELSSHLRERRTPEEWERQLHFNSVSRHYFADKAKKDQAMARAQRDEDTVALSSIRAAWSSRTKWYADTFPLFDEMLKSNERRTVRVQALSEMRSAVEDPGIAHTPQVPEIATAIKAFDTFVAARAQIGSGRTDAENAARTELTRQFQAWGDNAAKNPLLYGFYRGVIAPLAGLDPPTES